MSFIIFTYKAVDQAGQPVKGKVEAQSKEDAFGKIEELRQLGFRDIVIENANLLEQKAGESEEVPVKATGRKGMPLFAKIFHLLALLWTLFCIFGFFSGVAAVGSKGKPTTPETMMSECKRVWGDNYTMLETCIKSKEETAKKPKTETIGTAETVAISIGFFFWMMLWFFPVVGLEIMAIAITVASKKR